MMPFVRKKITRQVSIIFFRKKKEMICHKYGVWCICARVLVGVRFRLKTTEFFSSLLVLSRMSLTFGR